jgi:hypothetical protein
MTGSAFLTCEMSGETILDCGTYTYVRRWRHALGLENYFLEQGAADETWTRRKTTVVVLLPGVPHLQVH